jgi:hypothetical protein
MNDNPIEELWSKFKGKLRAIGARTKEHLDQAVGGALDQVTVKDILGWFNHSGVYATQSQNALNFICQGIAQVDAGLYHGVGRTSAGKPVRRFSVC